MKTLASPIKTFKSPGGRTFTVGRGTHEERFKGDTLWSDTFPILLKGKPAGKLFRSLSYGKTVDGKPRWHASISALRWEKAMSAPTGIGFDVAAFDTAAQALTAWGRSADGILDYAAGKPVHAYYGVTANKPAARASRKRVPNGAHCSICRGPHRPKHGKA